MEKTYKFRLYLNKQQKEIIENHFWASRWIYNYGLTKKIRLYQKENKRISCFDLIKELPTLKKEEGTKWLNNINAQSLQTSLRNLDNSFTKFFRDRKGFPNFKTKKGKQSFSIPQGNKIDFKNNRVSFIKIGSIKAVIDRTFEGRIIRATVSKNAIGQYFVAYIVESKDKEIKPKAIKEETTLGIDLGIKNFMVLSNGRKIENPKYLLKSEKRLKILQRQLSKKKKGSSNRVKARCRVAKLYLRIQNQRSYFLHNLTSQLTHDNRVGSYVLETLKIASMVKNHYLAKSINDVSWGEFVRQMKYKCQWYGKNLLFIGQFEPSSKMCFCGEINEKLTLADRKWTCPKCGQKNDRDLLASQNIKKFALQKQNLTTGSLRPVEPVEVSQYRGPMKQELRIS